MTAKKVAAAARPNVEAMAAAFGATVAFGVSLFMLRFVEEVELLLVLTLLLTVLVYGALEALRWYALYNDGVIDVFERVCIAMLTFFYTLLFFSAVQFAIRLGSDALESFPLPSVEDFLLLLGVILLLVFAAFPFIVIVATTRDDDDDGNKSKVGKGNARSASKDDEKKSF